MFMLPPYQHDTQENFPLGRFYFIFVLKLWNSRISIPQIHAGGCISVPGRCNRVPHTGWLRTGELCSLTFLETSSPKSAYRLGRPRTDASSRLSFLPSSSVRSPGHSLPRGSMIPASASVSVRLLSLCLCVFTWHSPRCISSPFLVRTQSESEVAQSCPTLCDPTDWL